MNKDFIVTKEHRRFTEFANAVRKERTIGICHGDAGVGRTQSARRYAHWDILEPFLTTWGPRSEEDDPPLHAAANRSRTVFYTPEFSPGRKTSYTTLGSCTVGSDSASTTTNAALARSPISWSGTPTSGSSS